MKRNDWILFIGVVALAILLLGIGVLKQGERKGTQVVVTVKGKAYGTYDLGKEQTIEIEGPLGINRLKITQGIARMEEAVCPDHYCIRQGEVSKEGQQIICLPNGITVEVVGGESLELDGIVY